MSVNIQIVSEQRYPTMGDWQFTPDKKVLNIRVLDTKNTRYNFLIAVHEFVEAMLCTDSNISETQVDHWDMTEFPALGVTCEPGEHKNCPYHTQHVIAEKIERELAVYLGINWNKYSEDVDDVFLKKYLKAAK